ncbi:MAG: hypothetical protein GX995_06595, partial [Clostridiales bacterium]|nr:hypothetical protein [Clostridiales bacterium]
RQRSQDNNKEDYKDDNNDNRTNRASLDGNSNSFRLQLQGLAKPKIRLDTTTWDILLYIPEQRLPYNSIFNQSPRYILESNYEDELDLQTYKNGNEIFIKELSIPIYDYIEHTFKFEYSYLREEFILELDTIMIFNEKGELESGTRLNNGNYYVVCNNEWNSAFDGIVYVYPSNLEGFNIYELQLREDKAVFKSSNNKVVEYIGSNVSLLVLNDYCLVEGVTLDGIKVSNGGLPTISINLCDVNISDTRITVYLNDNITFNKSLEELLDLDYIEKEDLLISVGLNYLLGQNPQVKKVKILLKDYSGNIIFLEEFWSITGTSFTYNNNYLDIKFSSWKRIEYKDQRQNAKRFSIPLLDKPGEIFSVFYKKAGWKRFNIEVPNITYSFVDKDGNRVDIPKDLLVSQLHILKDTYISWEVESKIPKAINVFDYDRNLETRLHLKKGTATLNLYSYYDTLKSTDSNTSLSFVWLAGNRYSLAETILNVFKKWEVSEIECYSKEEDDEYIVELKYKSN